STSPAGPRPAPPVGPHRIERGADRADLVVDAGSVGFKLDQRRSQGSTDLVRHKPPRLNLESLEHAWDSIRRRCTVLGITPIQRAVQCWVTLPAPIRTPNRLDEAPLASYHEVIAEGNGRKKPDGRIVGDEPHGRGHRAPGLRVVSRTRRSA